MIWELLLVVRDVKYFASGKGTDFLASMFSGTCIPHEACKQVGGLF